MANLTQTRSIIYLLCIQCRKFKEGGGGEREEKNSTILVVGLTSGIRTLTVDAICINVVCIRDERDEMTFRNHNLRYGDEMGYVGFQCRK